jgi:NADH-quinone oxidoreductase subunit L
MGKTFYGESHVDPQVAPHVHESPPSMTVPLIALAALSIVAGLALGLPLGDSVIHHWLAPVFEPALTTMGHHAEPYELFGIDGALIIVSVAVATIGMVAAWRLFGFFRIGARLGTVRQLTARVPRLYAGSFDKWYFDELNDLLFVRIGGRIADAAAWFDVRVVDGTVNGVAALTRRAGDELRHAQTGRVQNYALGIAGGLIVIAASLILVATR